MYNKQSTSRSDGGCAKAVWPVEIPPYRSMLCVIHCGSSGNGRAHCVKSLSTSVGGTWRGTTMRCAKGGRSGGAWCVNDRKRRRRLCTWPGVPGSLDEQPCFPNLETFFFSLPVPQNPPAGGMWTPFVPKWAARPAGSSPVTGQGSSPSLSLWHLR